MTLELDDARLDIDAARGGRITGLWFEGRNLLTGDDVDPINFGSTFWTSPQSQWGWPPIAEIDSAPYAVSRAGDVITLRGPRSETLGVSVDKRFQVDRARRAFRLEFIVTNHATSAARLAPWQVTRVRPGGLAFFAAGAGPLAHSDLPVRDEGGVTWLHHDAAVIGGHQKLFADTPEPWIAHLEGDALFVKSFEVVPREQHAPGEAQIELYASSAHRYLELEVQGAWETIPPGASQPWAITWRVRRVPTNVERALGSAALVDFARLVASGGA
ncbi:MAG TPA: DUF4380 domain-containing protein [Polyangia bacterium]|nr:DUF4380 domain-containing protein [Polyangia bacterium]